MKPEEIKQALADKDITLPMIADALSISPNNVYKVVNGDATSARVQQAVAVVLDKSIEEVFDMKPNHLSLAERKDQREKKVCAIRAKLQQASVA